MQDIISFRGLDSLRTSSENSNEMARLADIDSKNMVKLTTKSQRDASTLKKVTWLTSVYLPASFVSVSRIDPKFRVITADRCVPAILEHGLSHGQFQGKPSLTQFRRGDVDFCGAHVSVPRRDIGSVGLAGSTAQDIMVA